MAEPTMLIPLPDDMARLMKLTQWQAAEIERLRTENQRLASEAHTWSKAAEHYAKDAERWHGELQHDALDNLRRSAERCITAWTVVRGGVWDPNGLMDEHMAALRKALGPNVAIEPRR